MRRTMISTGTVLLLAFVVACSTEVRPAEHRATIPPDLILERFTVAKGGDALLIPVRFRGKDHLFVLDTGATHTVFDASLPLGAPRASTPAKTAGGVIVLNSYDPPEASIGELPFRVTGPIFAMDFASIREASGYPIEGVLGMDFLGRHVVHVDFDQGELFFLKSAPKDVGEEIPIFWQPGVIPEVVGVVTGGEPIRFRIDTGYNGFDSGSLGTQEVRNLVAGEKLRELGPGLAETAAGTTSRTEYQGSLLALGRFAIEGPAFSEDSDHSSLGLGFWSRFVVTFDFPGKRVFLSRGEGYGRPDRWDLCGLVLRRKSNAVVIDQVDEESPAEAAGVEKGDILLKLDDQRADEASLFELRARMCKTGRMECVVRRDGRDHRLTMNIAP